jgi:hypothetical protein
MPKAHLLLLLIAFAVYVNGTFGCFGCPGGDNDDDRGHWGDGDDNFANRIRLGNVLKKDHDRYVATQNGPETHFVAPPNVHRAKIVEANEEEDGHVKKAKTRGNVLSLVKWMKKKLHFGNKGV